MRKLGSLLLALCLGYNICAQTEIKLPAPNPSKSTKMTLMEALQKRHSIREYSDRAISEQTLSTLLWAACGYNRPSEKRITAPSAINAQDILVFVCNNQGAFRYNPDNHSLVQVTTVDLRPAIADRQDFAKSAPICLLLVSDLNKFRSPHTDLGAMDAGYVSENICLTCTALSLATVPRATMDKEALIRELKLQENQIPMLNHPIGWPKK